MARDESEIKEFFRNSVARKSFDQDSGSLIDAVNLTEQGKENEKEGMEDKGKNTPTVQDKINEEKDLVDPQSVDGWNPTNQMESDPTLDQGDISPNKMFEQMEATGNECFQQMIVDRMKNDIVKKLEKQEEEDEEFFRKAWKELTNN